MSIYNLILWTVVRFPDGTWSYGGSPDSKDYELCEKFQVWATDGKSAVKEAKKKRSRKVKK